MPRFSLQERERIRNLLLTEGEKLFINHGLKKVTIDDIIASVSIAKATFYKFYEGKEYLFLDIAEYRQQEIFQRLNQVLESNQQRPQKERVKEVFFLMSKMMGEYSILTGIDSEVKEIILRKVSQQRISEFIARGVDSVKVMEEQGIEFIYKTDVISSIFHALYQSWIELQKEEPAKQKQVMDILLEGVLSQIM